MALPGVLLALLVASLAPGAARAACGDHVQYHLPAGMKTPAETPASPQPVPPAKPCDGPNCSGGCTPLLPAPAPTDDERCGRPACLDATSALCRFERLTATDSARPTHRTADVFHPPRLS